MSTASGSSSATKPWLQPPKGSYFETKTQPLTAETKLMVAAWAFRTLKELIQQELDADEFEASAEGASERPVERRSILSEPQVEVRLSNMRSAFLSARQLGHQWPTHPLQRRDPGSEDEQTFTQACQSMRALLHIFQTDMVRGNGATGLGKSEGYSERHAKRDAIAYCKTMERSFSRVRERLETMKVAATPKLLRGLWFEL